MQIILNNRESALLILSGTFLLLALLKKDIRDSLYEVIKSLFCPVFIVPLVLAALYISLAVFILEKVSLWDTSMVKETIAWFIFAGISIVYRGINKKDVNKVFSDVLKDQVKITLIFQLIYSTYLFSILGEILWQVFFGIIMLVLQVNSLKNKDQNVEKVLSFLQNFMLLGLLIFLVKSFIDSPQELLSWKTLKVALLPIILGIWMIPIGYALSVYSLYEQLFFGFRNNNQSKWLRLYLKGRLIVIGKANANEIARMKSLLSYRLSEPKSKNEADSLISALKESLKESINDESSDLNWGDFDYGDTYSDMSLSEYLDRELQFYEQLTLIQSSLAEIHRSFMSSGSNFDDVSRDVLKYETQADKLRDEMSELDPPYEARKLRRKLCIYAGDIESIIFYFTDSFGNRGNQAAVEYLFDDAVKRVEQSRITCQKLFQYFVSK